MTVSHELSQCRMTRSLRSSTGTRVFKKELLQKPRLTLQRTEAVFSRKPPSCLTSIWLRSFSMPWGLKPSMRNDQDSQHLQHLPLSRAAGSTGREGALRLEQPCGKQMARLKEQLPARLRCHRFPSSQDGGESRGRDFPLTNSFTGDLPQSAVQAAPRSCWVMQAHSKQQCCCQQREPNPDSIS